MGAFDDAIEWLLASRDPSVRYLALTGVVGASPRNRRVREARAAIPRGPKVRALLRGQKRDGGFGVHPYAKWTGAHWRLVSLAELAIPSGHAKALEAANQVLSWLGSEAHGRGIRVVEGLVRQHASQEGNALAVCVRLGLLRDGRVRALVDSLLRSQWPDGGWNCDPDPASKHSSFYESITPLWGLSEYAGATADEEARRAADRAAELFLRHGVYRSHSTGAVANPKWLKLHYPLYWHYDVLHALLMLSRAGFATDRRTEDAIDLITSKRRRDGRWWPEGYFWMPPGTSGTTPEVVDWGRRGPSEMLTLNALRVFRSAGRL